MSYVTQRIVVEVSFAVIVAPSHSHDGVTVTAFTPPRHYHTTAPLRRTKKNTNTGGTPSPGVPSDQQPLRQRSPSEDPVRLRQQYVELALAYQTEVTKISSRGKENTNIGGTPPAVLSCTERFIELLSAERAPVKDAPTHSMLNPTKETHYPPTCPTDSPRTDPTVLTTMKFSGGMPIIAASAKDRIVLRRCIKDFTDVFMKNLDLQNKNFAADNNPHHKDACTYMVLLGHPGIGKSMALNFLVHNLLKVGRSVVVLKNNVGATSVHVFNCADETVDVTKWNALSIPIPVVKLPYGCPRRNATATSTAPGRPARRASD